MLADEFSRDPWPAWVLQGKVDLPVRLPAAAGATMVGTGVSPADATIIVRGAAGNFWAVP